MNHQIGREREREREIVRDDGDGREQVADVSFPEQDWGLSSSSSALHVLTCARSRIGIRHFLL